MLPKSIPYSCSKSKGRISVVDRRNDQAKMENHNKQQQQLSLIWLKKQSISSWIKSTWSSFSFRSLLIRQVLAAVSGLLVNFIITPLVIRFIDKDFGSSSLKRALLVSLVSMLLAFIFRRFRQVTKSVQTRQNCDTSSASGMDYSFGSQNDQFNTTGVEISNDYSVFTCFRFPVPERLGLIEAEPLHGKEQASKSQTSSSSLSEPTPPPWDQMQSVPSSWSPYAHQWFFPSAPLWQSAMKEEGKFKNSRWSSQPECKNQTANSQCLLHKSLFHPLYTTTSTTHQASLPPASFSHPTFPKQAASHKHTTRSMSQNPRKKAAYKQGWAWKFLEEANFQKFKRDFNRFRNTNDGENAGNNKAYWRANPDAKGMRKENRPKLNKAEPAQPVTAASDGRRKPAEKGRQKGGGCLKRFLSSFCIQLLMRKRHWNSRRFRQIAHVPFSSPPSTPMAEQPTYMYN